MIEIHANFHILFDLTNFSLTLVPLFVNVRYKVKISNSNFDDFVFLSDLWKVTREKSPWLIFLKDVYDEKHKLCI